MRGKKGKVVHAILVRVPYTDIIIVGSISICNVVLIMGSTLAFSPVPSFKLSRVVGKVLQSGLSYKLSTRRVLLASFGF